MKQDINNLQNSKDPKVSRTNSKTLYGPDESGFTQSTIRSIPVSEYPEATNTTLTTGLNKLPEKQENFLIQYNHITYLLYMLSFFTAGMTSIIPVILNYLRRREADNTWLATHFDWQIKTFWYTIVAYCVGAGLLLFSILVLGFSFINASSNVAISSVVIVIVGILFMLWAFIWHLYRIIRGWIALSNHHPIQ